MSCRVISFAAPAAVERSAAAAAEVGWLLATAGHRVLLVDAGVLSLAAYFDLFPAMARPQLDPEDRWALAPLAGTDRFRYLLPGESQALDLLRPLTQPDGKPDPAGVRTAFDRLGYEYALVSAPTERWSREAELLAALSDLVVLCLPATEASAQAMGEIAGRLRRLAAPPEIIAATSHQAINDPDVRAARRRTIQRALAPPGEPTRGPQVIEVGDQPNLDRWVLTPLMVDEPVGYGALFAAATSRSEPQVPDVAPRLRRRYRRRAGGVTDADPERIWVAYAGPERGWAEWVVSELSRAGADARLLADPPDPEDTAGTPAFVVLGPADRLARPDQERLTAHLNRFAPEPGPEIIQIQVPGTGPPGEVRYPARALDLSIAPEPEARARLLAPFLLAPPHEPDVADAADGQWRPRFPRRDTATTNQPPPNPDFVGREDELARLREGLLAGRTMLVTGPPAAGKSEIARAYAHRFGFDYDVVWWVPVHDSQSARDQFGRLAEEPADRKRWLLVFDDAEDLASLPDPASLRGSGHVVVTARRATVAGDTIPVPMKLDPAAGVRLLTRRNQGLSRADADLLVDRFGAEPLALRLVAAALRERRAQGMTGAALSERAVRSYVDYVDTFPEPGMGGTPAAVRAALRHLEETGETGVRTLWLARMCVFASPEGISLNLLRTDPMLNALAGLSAPAQQSLLDDGAVLDSVVWLGARLGLFDVDWGRNNLLRVHRVIQRELAAATPTDDLDRARRAMLAGLAGCVPSDAELEITANRGRFDELRPHLLPSGALEDDDHAVRRWVVSQIQYAARYGDAAECRKALELTDSIRARWTSDPQQHVELRLRLDAERARLHANLDEYESAATIQQQLRDELARELGRDHIRTLLANRASARYLRGLGRFADAQHQDHIAHEGLRRQCGRSHPNTVRAANSLALDTFLAGDVNAAAHLQRDVVARLGGQTNWERDNPWLYAGNLGMYLRELGQYQEASEVLEEALAGIRGGARTTAALRVELRIRRNLAGILRWQGRARAAHAKDQEILDEFIAMVGPDDADDLDTLAARLALAADEHALGETDRAIDLAVSVHEGYQRALPPGHPYRDLCELALSVFQLAANQLERAREGTERARQRLAAALGERHPWTLAAEANRLLVLAAAESPEGVAHQLDALLAECEEYLPTAHPYGRVVAENRERVLAGRQARPIIIEFPWI